MKQLYTFFFIALALGLRAQETVILEQQDLHEVHLQAGPVLFQNPDFTGGYRLLDPSNPDLGISTMFSAALWYSAITPDANIYVGAATFGFEEDNVRMDYGPSSLVFDDEYHERYGEINLLTREEVNNHISNWNTPGYVVPDNILNYPANGRAGMGESQFLAPYADVTENGLYEPEQGDYPLIRGNQCATWIIHDVPADGIVRARMEIIHQAYTVDSDDENIASTLFMHSIFQNTTTSTFDLRAGLWVDWDLGNPFDDYIACRPDKNYFFVYNADEDDEPSQISQGMGTDLISQGALFLNTPLDGHMTHNVGGNPMTGSPSTVADYYNYLRSHYLNGQHWTEGIFAGTEPVEVPNEVYDYVYPWPVNPEDMDDYITEFSADNPPGDRRALGSVDLGVMLPYERKCLDYAFVHGRRTEQEQFNELISLEANVDAVQAYYNAEALDCLELGVIAGLNGQETPQEMSLFPNPATDKVRLATSTSKLLEVRIFNSLGQQVMFQKISSGESLDITSLSYGLYTVRVPGFTPQKLIRR